MKVLAVILLSLLCAGVAHADTYGSLAVYKGGNKVSEASGGSVYRVDTGSYDSMRVRMRFRDVTADGWGTYARALQDAWDCTPSGCSWLRMNNDESNKYGTADGWRTTYLTEGRPWELGYRSNPNVCHHEPWYDPDDCDSAGWVRP